MLKVASKKAARAMRWVPKSRPGWVRAGFFALLVVGLVTGTIILAIKWPFTKANITHELEDLSASRVEIQSFHTTYFPRPGCVAQGIFIRHGQDVSGQPFIALSSMRIESGILGLFNKHLARVTANGVHVTVPHGMQERFLGAKMSKIVVQELIADDSLLEFSSGNSAKKPFSFHIQRFRLHNVGRQTVTSFDVALANPLPPGEVTARGHLGPWQENRVQTAISGAYQFTNADLGVFGGIKGKLNSRGTFSGTLRAIEAAGNIDVPDFQVSSSPNHTELKSEFTAVVNARNGNVDLKKVLARVRQTTLLASGRIAAPAGKGRSAELSLSCMNGRIEDLLRLFTESSRGPMSGVVNFTAHAKIPPGKDPFLRKLQLAGDFGISDSEFNKPDTQQSVDRLSAGARGEKEPEKSGLVLSDLKGRAVLQQGVARLSDITFGVPGALAQMHGTYNVISQQVNLHGDLTTRKSIANTTSGVKSAFLRVLSPFFKKKHSEKAPVKVTGTYSHPSFGLDIGGG
jgi:hypothetical protein